MFFPTELLQRSGALADAATWKSILIDGMLSKQGMVSFAKVMSADQAQSIRFYIIDEANWAKQNLPQPVAAAADHGAKKVPTGAVQ